jgi:hypothetical protein
MNTKTAIDRHRGAATLALLLAASCAPPDISASESGAVGTSSSAVDADPEWQHPMHWFPDARAANPLEIDRGPGRTRMARPLFSCDVTSFAWGNVAFGHVLDEEGQIWFYDLGQKWSAFDAPEPELFLESGLRVRFNQPVLQSRRVDQDELDAMQLKAELAREGRVQVETVSRDMGASGCTAYLWEAPQAYRGVELGTFGDTSYRNLSPDAADLLVWLRQDLGMGLAVR